MTVKQMERNEEEKYIVFNGAAATFVLIIQEISEINTHIVGNCLCKSDKMNSSEMSVMTMFALSFVTRKHFFGIF